MKFRQFAAWMLLLGLLFSLPGCRGKEGTNQEVPAGDEEGPRESVIVSEDGTRWLTHIYKSRELEIPEGWEFKASGGLEVLRERNEYRGLLLRGVEREEENGDLRQIWETEIAVWDGDGALRSQIIFLVFSE